MNPETMKRVLAFCGERGMSEEDLTALTAMLGDDGSETMDDLDPRGSTSTSAGAMDAAIMTGTGNAVKVMQAIRAAEAEVAPRVGAVLGQDSAAAVYGVALRRLGHDTAGIHPTGLQTLYRTVRGRGVRPTMAARGGESFDKMFGAGRIKAAF